MATHMSAHMKRILMGVTTSILLGLLLLLPHVHALAIDNLNQPGYWPPSNLVGDNNPNQGQHWDYNNPNYPDWSAFTQEKKNDPQFPYWSPFMNLKGTFCGKEQEHKCCTKGQDDRCKVKVRDTYCYCDTHCYRNDTMIRKHPDCCPDYYDECLGNTRSCYRPCPETVHQEVCGTDRHTYKNMCLLSIATCQNPEVTLYQTGYCPHPNVIDDYGLGDW